MLAPVDYLAIGHVTHDVLPGASYVVGGTVSYAALTVASLGRTVGILTSAGEDFDWSVFNGSVAVSCDHAPHTTTFTNTYVNGSRHQQVHGLAKSLGRSSVPDEWRQPSVVHIGPVIGECDSALITYFHESTFVGVTTQGWMRSQNGRGRVLPHAWNVEVSLLERVSAVVFSLDDIRGDWRVATQFARHARLLVVTMGRRGGVVFADGKPMPFPALIVDEADPTGAGDIFAAAFFTTVASGAKPIDAARFAACLASRSVARKGPDAVPGDDDIAACDGLLMGKGL